MDVSILTVDGVRLNVIRAHGLDLAQRLYPGMVCVPRGSAEDKAAREAPQPAAPEMPEVVTKAELADAMSRVKGRGGKADDIEAVWAEATKKGARAAEVSPSKG